MTVLNTEYTMRDVLATQDQEGRYLPLVDVLSDTNDFWNYLPMKPTGELMSEPTAMLTTRPTGTYTSVNQGVTFSKHHSRTVRDNVSMLEAASRVDARLGVAGSIAQMRMHADKAFLSSLRDQQASTLMYGNEATNPEEFNGIMVRYDTLPTDEDDDNVEAYNVLDGGGSASDNASIVIARLSAEDGLCGLYPRNGVAGLVMEDKGKKFLPVDDSPSTGGYADYWVTMFRWYFGISVKDWRNVVRIANIDVSDLKAGTGADLHKLVMDGIEHLRSKDNAFIIVPRRVKQEWSKIQRFEKEQFQIEGSDRFVQMESFGGLPIIRSDAMLLTEDAVS